MRISPGPQKEAAKFKRGDGTYSTYEGASEDVQQLLKSLERGSKPMTNEPGETGINLITTSSILNFQQETTSITWTNQVAKNTFAYQKRMIGKNTAYTTIRKKSFRSLNGETFEKIESNIFLVRESDPLPSGQKLLGIRMVYRSMERYESKLSVSLNVYRQVLPEDDHGILAAAQLGDLESIRDRCSTGEWSLWTCDETGSTTLVHAILGALSDPYFSEGCMDVIKLILNEAPNLCLTAPMEDQSIVSTIMSVVMVPHPWPGAQEATYPRLDTVLRYIMSVGYDFSEDATGLASCILFGSLENAITVLCNETSYIVIDDSFIVTFLEHVAFDYSQCGRTTYLEEVPEKLGMLLRRLDKNPDVFEHEYRAYFCFFYLLTSIGRVPSDDIVEMLTLTIDAMGDIYAPSARVNVSEGSGLFCTRAHHYGLRREWYEALGRCKYHYTRLQAISWEAGFLGVTFNYYCRFLEYVEDWGIAGYGTSGLSFGPEGCINFSLIRDHFRASFDLEEVDLMLL
ncbi:hypothetical protein TWF730_003175 [Orbilia blumenaviensis]|uniref:Uncharacterized protein n=1 Tax=Orbilia blumenaviensis TaxID=1796055 RepID=A0AAV9U552_9PEZI